jgi:hypothetical protein
MKPQVKSSCETDFSASVLRDLRTAYRALERAIRGHPCLAQGSVNALAPKTSSGNVTYTWTRKASAKTVTQALSKKQAVAFRRAIVANRRVEEALRRLREVSQTALLSHLPGVPKRRLGLAKMDRPPNVQKGA